MQVVYADSLNPISRDDFYFTGNGGTPDISASFAGSIARLVAYWTKAVSTGMT
jgi:metallo-beta-lactamase class B